MEVRMICTRPTKYAGKRLQPGDRFVVKGERDARIMRAIKAARDPGPDDFARPPAQAATTQAYETRSLTARQPEAAEQPPAEKPKRTYTRRDQVAE